MKQYHNESTRQSDLTLNSTRLQLLLMTHVISTQMILLLTIVASLQSDVSRTKTYE
jgi:hypothetical protein